MRILFASIPLEGHFNPLTSLAVHLKETGHDVRWYTGGTFEKKLQTLGIPYLPFKHAKEVTQHNIDELFPKRSKIKSTVKKLRFDMCNIFILRGPEFFADLKEIQQFFAFDLVVADICFTGIPFIKDKLGVPVITVGIMPLVESSKDTAPTGLGLPPASTTVGKLAHNVLQKLVDNVLFKQPTDLFKKLVAEEGIACSQNNVFDIAIEKSSVVLQSGTPGFEYERSDMSRHIHFIGPLLPHSSGKKIDLPFSSKLSTYKKVILVTQGTMESDCTKIIVPTLEAFKNSNFLVIVATAGNHTKELRQQYPFDNCVIEDYIPFDQLLPFVDVYVSNGGYGGVMQSIMHRVPMVVGGKHEGKNEVCARVGHFKLGINLKTERPHKKQIRKAVEEVLLNSEYRSNVAALAKEFGTYNPQQLCAQFAESLVAMADIRTLAHAPLSLT